MKNKKYRIVDRKGNEYLWHTDVNYLLNYIEAFKFRFFYLDYVSIYDEMGELIQVVNIKNSIIRDTKKLQDFEQLNLKGEIEKLNPDFFKEQRGRIDNFIKNTTVSKTPEQLLKEFLDEPFI